MSRDYVRLHRPMLLSEKWIGLSITGKAAWTTLLMACGNEGEFRSRSHAEAILKRDGFTDPMAVVGELLKVRLLDLTEGSLVMHDWADHQAVWRGPSDEPEAVAARMRASRDRKRGVTTVTTDVTTEVAQVVPKETVVTPRNVTIEERREEEIRRTDPLEDQEAPPPTSDRDRYQRTTYSRQTTQRETSIQRTHKEDEANRAKAASVEDLQALMASKGWRVAPDAKEN